MLKQLIKKQFFECFRSYFVNPKTGKRRSKGGIIGYLVFFVFVMLFLCGVFFSVGAGLGIMLFEIGLDTLFFIIMGLISLLLGVFGSVFNTYSTMYLSKDNELLLSMPIKPRTILLSRISVVYGLGLLYGGAVWLPSIVCYIIFGTPKALGIVFSVLLLPIIALLITVITCALGYVIAKISTKLKGKSIITVIASLIFFFAYYFICIKAGNVIARIAEMGEDMLVGFKKWGNIVYVLGKAATGDILCFLLFFGICVLLTLLVLYILDRSFIKITTTSVSQGKRSTKEVIKVRSLKKTILSKEFKRFTSSATYMLNCGIGIIFVIAIPVILLIKRNDILIGIDEFSQILPEITSYIGLAIILLPCVMLAINGISGPSIALEGKNLWIVKSLPISTVDVLYAKKCVHTYVNGIPGALATIGTGVILKQDFSDVIFYALIVYLIINIQATVGLLIGLRHPNFDWTNEVVPIKQDASLLLLYLINFLIPIVLCGAYYFLRNILSVSNYIYGLLIVCCIIGKLLDKYLYSKGAKKFEKL